MISFKKGLCLNTSAVESNDDSTNCDEEFDEENEEEEEGTDEMEILLPSCLKGSQDDGITNDMILPEEDPLFLPSGDDLSNQFYTDDESSRTSGIFQNDPLQSIEDIKSSSIQIKNPQQINIGGVESDSDSDVILVERRQEVIELSDDDTNDCADLIQTLDVPDGIIDSLKHASNKISLKLGELVRSEKEVTDITVEVPTVTWSLPWKVVSGIFRNPNLPTKSKNSGEPKKRDKHPLNVVPRKSKRKNSDDSALKNKMFKKSESLSSNIDEMGKTVSNIKKENENDRALSVIHFDPNKPPEFCEVSRSGRVIKKPIRLKDDVTFFRRTHVWKKRNGGRRKSGDLECDEDIASNSNIEENDSLRETSDESFDNSIDSEICDRWMLGLNSDIDDDIYDMDISHNYNQNKTNNPTSETNDQTSITDQLPFEQEPQSFTDLFRHRNYFRMSQNLKEQNRRRHLKKLFCNLIQNVKGISSNYINDSKIPKIQILIETMLAISHLESGLQNLATTKKNLKLVNKMLLEKLSKLEESVDMLPDSLTSSPI